MAAAEDRGFSGGMLVVRNGVLGKWRRSSDSCPREFQFSRRGGVSRNSRAKRLVSRRPRDWHLSILEPARAVIVQFLYYIIHTHTHRSMIMSTYYLVGDIRFHARRRLFETFSAKLRDCQSVRKEESERDFMAALFSKRTRGEYGAFVLFSTSLILRIAGELNFGIGWRAN